MGAPAPSWGWGPPTAEGAAYEPGGVEAGLIYNGKPDLTGAWVGAGGKEEAVLWTFQSRRPLGGLGGPCPNLGQGPPSPRPPTEEEAAEDRRVGEPEP